jgi:cobalt/nickel transport system ATP-binding protein
VDYGPATPVLDRLDLRLGAGERIGLTGSNGSGKTTLLHLVVGLLRPRAGVVRCFGAERRAEADFAEVRARVGLVFQDPDDQLFCPTVLEDVAFGPLNIGCTPAEARRRSAAALDQVGLSGFEDGITYRLSGGEKRLVSLATVLAMEPEALLLDEPTTGLDPDANQRVQTVLSELPQAMLVVSHETNLLHEVTGTVLRLEAGRLRPEGSGP